MAHKQMKAFRLIIILKAQAEVTNRHLPPPRLACVAEVGALSSDADKVRGHRSAVHTDGKTA